MDLKHALSQLDPKDDTQWTSDGAPLVEAVSRIAGRQVTRKEIVDADPALTRAAASDRALAALDASKTDEDLTGEVTGEATGAPREEVKGRLGDFDFPTATNGAPMLDNPNPDPVDTRSPALVELDEEIADLDRDLVAIVDAIAKLSKDRDLVAKRHEALCARRDRIAPRIDQQNGDGIRQYLERSHRARAERVQRVQATITNGAKLGEVLEAARGVSRIDAALGHRRGPVGSVGRPQRPLMPAQGKVEPQ